MMLASCKTRIVCTIGPASATPEIMLRLLHAGMNIARLNYAHGDFAGHQTAIGNLRRAALAADRSLAIVADLPGPKMRIGALVPETIVLKRDELFTLTTDDIVGDQQRVSVNFSRLPELVKPGDILYLNDGAIQLQVVKVAGKTVACAVLVGGELRSRKGVNLPGSSLGVGAFTDHDHDCLKSALDNGVDAVCQSFVETPADVEAVRKAAAEMGHHPFIIAKIERAGAIEHIDAILRVSDGVMIARGDLGVEIPMESMALVQKQLICKANLLGKPVITATQMLESMMDHHRPTRAESTDVANAVLDGVDCVMLSEESAMGRFPVEAVSMLAKIAATTEPHRLDGRLHEVFADYDRDHKVPLADFVSHTVQHSVEHLSPSAVFVSTSMGYTARMMSRFKRPVWIVAVSQERATCQGLQFSYGVHSVYEPKPIEDWNEFARRWVQVHELTAGLVVLTEGPSPDHPTANHRLEVIDLSLVASTTEPKTVVKVEPRVLIKTEIKPEAKVKPKPEAKSEPKSEVKAESGPEIEVEPKPEARSEPKSEVKAESGPEIEVELKPEAKSKPKSDVKAESGPEIEVELKPEATADGHAGEERLRAGHDHNWVEFAPAPGKTEKNRSDVKAVERIRKVTRATVVDAAVGAIGQVDSNTSGAEH